MPRPPASATPLPAYAAPAYPTRSEVEQRPRFLLKHLPRRWQGNRLLLLLLAGTLPTVPGCAKSAAGVAPISDHGDGMGWFGCEVIVPPVFLSEAEAIAVVKDELEAAGLAAMDENVVVDGVTISKLKVSDCDEDFTASSSRVAFSADLYDEGRELAVELVSEEDFTMLATDGDPGCDSSVDSVNLKAAAQVLVEDLEDRGDGKWYGVLYDPAVYPDVDGYQDCWQAEDATACQEELEEDARAETESQLRAQVQDLVSWMQSKGLL